MYLCTFGKVNFFIVIKLKSLVKPTLMLTLVDRGNNVKCLRVTMNFFVFVYFETLYGRNLAVNGGKK